MKKKILLLTIGASICFSTFSQSTVPNAGFETWTNMGTYEEPSSWITLNVFSSLVQGYPITATKSNDAHTGSYALKLETLKVVGGSEDTIVGTVLSGTGTFLTVSALPFSSRPSRMKFYYKGGPMTDDTSAVAVYLTKWNSQTNSQITIGSADTAIISIVNNYTLIDLPIDYVSLDNPDSISILVMSSFGETPIPGSVLYLDDISFEPFALGITETQTYNSSIFPNPVKDEFQINIERIEAKSIVILDLLGRKLDEIEITNPNLLIDVKHIDSGNYFYQLKYNEDILSLGKFTINR